MKARRRASTTGDATPKTAVLKGREWVEEYLSAESFARTAYREILSRDIDPDALSNVIKSLAAGHSQTEILVGLVQSDEYLARVARTRQQSISIQGGLNKAPAWLQVESTGRCNLKCSCCPRTSRKPNPDRKFSDFPEGLWPEIVRLAPDCGYVMLHGFGEPLCCSTLFEKLKSLDDAGVATGFSTNGIGAERLARKLGTLRHLLHINVSIDSFDPAIYHRLRGAELSRAIRGLVALVRNLPNTMISVSSLATRENLVGIEAVPAILRDLNVNHFCWQTIVGPARVRAGIEPHQLPEARRILAELREECSSCGVQLTISPTLEAELSDPQSASNSGLDSSKSRICTIPFESIYIDCRGQVFPCCNADQGTPVGDLRLQMLAEIWHGTNLLRFREQLLSSAPPAVCRSCPAALPGENPLTRYKCSIVSLAAYSHYEDVEVLLKVRNTGSVTWGESALVRVGTAQPRDRVEKRQLPGWICWNRPCGMRERIVPPGEMASFHFFLRPERQRRESFQLVVEGQCWLPDSQFFLEFRDSESTGGQGAASLPLVSLFP